jgi:hypothetical protein
VSRDLAATIFSRNTGDVSASVVASQTDPVHTPGRTHRHAGRHLPPGHDPACRQDRHRTEFFDRTHHLGDQHESRYFAAMTTRLAALRDQQIDPASIWRTACSRAPIKAAQGMPNARARSSIDVGGTPSALTISLVP